MSTRGPTGFKKMTCKPGHDPRTEEQAGSKLFTAFVGQDLAEGEARQSTEIPFYEGDKWRCELRKDEEVS